MAAVVVGVPQKTLGKLFKAGSSHIYIYRDSRQTDIELENGKW